MAVKNKASSFTQFTETATIHGLYKVGHSSTKIHKVVWTFIVIGLFGGLVYEITRLFIEHYSYKIYVKIEKKTLKTIKFPSVTICHANNFRMSTFKKFVPNAELIMKKTINMGKAMNKIYHPDMLGLLKYKALLKTNMSVNRETSSSPKLHESPFMDWCIWSTVEQCKYPDDFKEYIYYSTVGFCKTFNTEGKYTQIAPGNIFGLRLKLYINQQDQLPFLTGSGAGAMVMVHPQDVYPNPFSQSLLVPTGHLTRIALRRTTNYRKKSPYPSNCSDGNGIFQAYPGKYTVVNCQFTCYLKLAVENCGAVDIAYMYHKPKELNESLKEFYKKNNSFADINSCLRQQIQDFLQHKIECHCPPPCREEKIHTFSTATQWPQPADLEYYRPFIAKLSKKPTVSDEEIYRSLVHLEIYYEELSEEDTLEEVASILAKLVANVGGMSGLWLGASFFSFIELLLFIVTSIGGIFKARIEPVKENVVD